jgi:hypothetical protein
LPVIPIRARNEEDLDMNPLSAELVQAIIDERMAEAARWRLTHGARRRPRLPVLQRIRQLRLPKVRLYRPAV